MATKKITTFTIGILAIAISAPFAVHYLSPSPPATNRHTAYQVRTRQTYQLTKQQGPYRHASAETFFTNDNIALFIVAPLVIFAMIGGLFIIYRKEFEASSIIARDLNQLPETVVSNIETTVAPHTTVYSAHNTRLSPVVTLSHDESGNTLYNSDDNSAQNVDSNHDNTQGGPDHYDRDDSSSSSILLSTNNTIGAAISSPFLPKDINPYPLHTQGGIKEHYLQPRSGFKVYEATPTRRSPTKPSKFSLANFLGTERKSTDTPEEQKEKMPLLDDDKPQAYNVNNDIAYPQQTPSQAHSRVSSSLLAIPEAHEDDQKAHIKTFLPQNNHAEDIQQTTDLTHLLALMLQGQALNNDKVTNADISIYEKLTSKEGAVSAKAKKIWDTFRHQQQRITIDMQYMYRYYAKLREKLCLPEPVKQQDLACKNLLLFDKIVEIFPNVTEIICTQTDYVGARVRGYKHNVAGYSSAVVSAGFINGLHTRLRTMQNNNQHKLQKIIIQTSDYQIGNNYKLYATQFDALGWHIGRGNKTIMLTKSLYDDFYNFIPKIKSMIQGETPQDEATSLHKAIFNKLISGAKDVSADVKKIWDQFRDQQHSITIDMHYMYNYYEAFIPLLFDKNLENLLLLDKIAKIFPNVTEITCKHTDYIRQGTRKNKCDKWGYSPTVVSLGFIKGLQTMLGKMTDNTQHSLQKIIIRTGKNKVPVKKKIFYRNKKHKLNKLGWYIGKGNHTIVATKNPYDDCRAKISSIIQGQAPSSEVTSLDVTIFKKLIARAKDVPPNALQVWKVFCDQQQSITINIKWMYHHYELFGPLLVDKKHKNLLLFDKIIQIFPKVTQITCEEIDWNGYQGAYIVNSTFIQILAAKLRQIDKQATLQKIILTMGSDKIKYKLHERKFMEAGWTIQTERNNQQIALTKVKGASKNHK